MASCIHQSSARWTLNGTLTLLATLLLTQLLAQTAHAQTFINTFDRAAVNVAGCHRDKKVLNEVLDPGTFTFVTSGTCAITIIWEDRFTNCVARALVNASSNSFPTYWIAALGVEEVLDGTGQPSARGDEDTDVTYWKPDSCAFQYR